MGKCEDSIILFLLFFLMKFLCLWVGEWMGGRLGSLYKDFICVCVGVFQCVQCVLVCFIFESLFPLVKNFFFTLFWLQRKQGGLYRLFCFAFAALDSHFVGDGCFCFWEEGERRYFFPATNFNSDTTDVGCFTNRHAKSWSYDGAGSS